MTGRPGYTVEEARADAREWIKGVTAHEGSRGWRVCCAILDERIEELEKMLRGIVQHWDEFGGMMGVKDDYGLGERLDAAGRLIGKGSADADT